MTDYPTLFSGVDMAYYEESIQKAVKQRGSDDGGNLMLYFDEERNPNVKAKTLSAIPSVEIRGDERICSLWPHAIPAVEADWSTEYGDLILSVRVVDSLEEAINHISRYSTHHSECIVTENKKNARLFVNAIDAACVYVNASTRFTDGFEFGFGAEIGISTQKLHVRGPMGLEALVTCKYKIFGDGQVRG